ncbi:hypothetical protein [Nocardia suismassiliense]|uniref:hypothetical protein n=1 Tax=Nocardia suismassiliense TaxID=2077092 RepID=UPI000D1DC507|nr:hypothetical protein [Nocardia suismassiliense]
MSPLNPLPTIAAWWLTGTAVLYRAIHSSLPKTSHALSAITSAAWAAASFGYGGEDLREVQAHNHAVDLFVVLNGHGISCAAKATDAVITMMAGEHELPEPTPRVLALVRSFLAQVPADAEPDAGR